MLQKNKNNILVGLLVLMLIGSLASRAVLSISMIGFILLATVHRDFVQQLKQLFTNRLTLAMSVLFFIPFISGLWSTDIQNWSKLVIDKLPLLLLPLAFAGNWSPSQQQWELFGKSFIAIITLATFWSFGMYLSDMGTVHANYLRAKTMIVPMRGDHVRFSWLVSIAFTSCFLLVHVIGQQRQKIVLLLVAGWLLIYLHVLAVRTGLACCYLFILVYFVYHLFHHTRQKTHWLLILSVIAVAVAAWFLFPTLQNRFRYLDYNLPFVKNSAYLPGATDGNRVLSFRAGWAILSDQPLGTGAGDVKKEVSQWYDTHVPRIRPEDKIFPSNEWLIHGCFAGWTGIGLFSLVVFLPLFIKSSKHNVFWITLHSMALFVLAVDSSLETQYGIYIYAFTTLWWWKWLHMQKE